MLCRFSLIEKIHHGIGRHLPQVGRNILGYLSKVVVSQVIDGFADLLGRDGNQDARHRTKLAWRYDNWGASVSALTIGSFYQSSLTLGDGSRFVIPSMTTYDATVDYRTKLADTNLRFRLGMRNLTNERAPLADRYFGFFSDAHSDYGRSLYLDVRASF